jgi:16S rRNA U1498 N3-methylase RsmE
MQLFYAPDIVPPEYTLSEEESKHCIRVLRMACGEELHITDGRAQPHPNSYGPSHFPVPGVLATTLWSF